MNKLNFFSKLLLIYFYSISPNISYAQDIEHAPLDQKPQVFTKIYDTFCKNISEHYYDPYFGGNDWKSICEKGRIKAAQAPNLVNLRSVMQDDADKLGSSHNKVMPAKIKDANNDPIFLDTMAYLATQRIDKITKAPEYKLAHGVNVFSKPMADGNFIIIGDVIKESEAYNLGIRPGHVLLLNDKHDDKTTKITFYSGLLIPLTLPEIPKDFAIKLREQQELQEKRDYKAIFGKDGIRVKLAVKNNKLSEEILIADKGNGIKYIRFDSFNIDKLATKITDSITKEDTKLIIDLRHNIGGKGYNLNELLSYFIADNTLLYETKCRKNKFTTNAKPTAFKYNKKLVILISPETSSAAEMFAAIMQKQKQTIIMGSRSSGLVLNSIKMPLEPYFTQSIPICDVKIIGYDRIEGKGVLPDVIFDNHVVEEKDFDKDAVLDAAIAKLYEK